MRQAAHAQAQTKEAKPRYVIAPAYTGSSKTPVTQTGPADGPVKIDLK